MNTCPLCHLPSETVLATELRRGVGRVLYCSPCELGFLDAEPVDVEAYYRDQYRREVSNAAAGGEISAEEIFRVYSRYQGSRLAYVTPHVGRGDSVLEIGAGSGQFLWHLRHDGARLFATELNPDSCAFMRSQFNIDTDERLLPKSRYWGSQFDVVCAFQVMEHVDDPIKFLDEVGHVMKPGGRAFIEVPNLHDPLLSVWASDAYRSFYYHAQHRLYFTAQSLMLAAKMAGFTKARVEFTQDYNLLNHLHWVMNGTPQPTCDIGLGDIALKGANGYLTKWLSEELHALNDKYVDALKRSHATSNLMLTLTKGE